MYFIEILSKIFNNNNLKKFRLFKKDSNVDEFDETKCNHTFVAIDSTQKVFACINCGLVINKNNENNKKDNE